MTWEIYKENLTWGPPYLSSLKNAPPISEWNDRILIWCLKVTGTAILIGVVALPIIVMAVNRNLPVKDIAALVTMEAAALGVGVLLACLLCKNLGHPEKDLERL